MKIELKPMEELKQLNKKRQLPTKLEGKHHEITHRYVVDRMSVRKLAKEYNCGKSLIHRIIQKQLRD